jgi:Holliday junction resolvase RusA-like endonuclease
MKINIKPLSVNECYRGRRFKNDKYKAYETELLLRLPPLKIPEKNLCVNLVFGFSNDASDIDNGVKIFLDILQKAYEFNDKEIYELHVFKEVVKKGKEYIDFSII